MFARGGVGGEDRERPYLSIVLFSVALPFLLPSLRSNISSRSPCIPLSQAPASPSSVLVLHTSPNPEL